MCCLCCYCLAGKGDLKVSNHQWLFALFDWAIFLWSKEEASSPWGLAAQKGACVRSKISIGYVAPHITLPHLFWILPFWEAVGYLFLQIMLDNPVCAYGKKQRRSTYERMIIGAFLPFSHLLFWASPATDLHRKMPLYTGMMSIDGRTNYCI